MRLEEDKLEALRHWGRGLRDAGGEEHAAAGRAILMLIEEIDRLRLDLLRAGERTARVDAATDEIDNDTDESLASTLRRHLPRVAKRGPERTEADAVDETTTTSPQAWIESLRRQE